MKKVISLFLSLAMLLSIVSVVDFSAFADVQTGSCGDNVTYSLDTETGVLTISGTGKMTDYSAEDCPFNNRAYIKSVIIENGVISIGNYAFSYFGSLTNVTIPNSVTSIGYDAFNYCKSLTSVTIPDSVTSIGEVAFSSCTSLTSVTIPNSVTSIGDCAFEDCYFTFENFVNNSNVELNDSSKPMIVDTDDKGICIKNNVLVKMRPAYAIGEVTIPNTVTSIGDGAFDNCESLTSVAIPDSVTSIGSGAFYDCTNLANVYYAGAEDEWNNITISDENEDLTNATIHFSSTPTPKPTPTPTPEPTPTPNPAPQPSTQPTQETQQQVAQQTAQQQSVKNDTAAEQVSVAKPKSTNPKKVKAAKKAISVTWKKVGGVKGYQIQIATDKKFKKNKKTVTVKKQKTTKTTVKKLKAKKKYYVRVRTYKIVNGKKVYSSWSKVKSVKTK
ncbi:MAG: leucine-rich repeat domain-containing protein [Eubacterium sp.]